ncbi:hypothetical protein ECZU29_63200 [Escherichia coli]|nr:hypothetical protein ECZU29_63200 [Escherichia coli]
MSISAASSQIPVLADVISQRRTAVINLHTGTAVPAVAGIVRVADALRADHPELCPESRDELVSGGLNEQFTVKGVHGHTFPNHHGKRAFSLNVNAAAVILGKLFPCRFNLAGKGTGFFLPDAQIAPAWR